MIVDNEYNDSSCITPRLSFLLPENIHAAVRARHETVKSRLKQFNVLAGKFRHNLDFHGAFFHAVGNSKQLMLSSNPFYHMDF